MNSKLNSLKIVIDSKSINESYARYSVSGFIAQLDPTVEEMADIRCAVSEAVTNCIVHAYREKEGKIYISVDYFEDRTVKIRIKDSGCGIEDIEKAKQPLFTTEPGGERSGMGFPIMENFMDKLKVKSSPGKGTTVTLIKKFKLSEEEQ